MADRSRLHINKLEEFKEWLVKDGWEIGEPKGDWEVLRARKSGRQNPLIIYTKMNAKEHLSVMDRDSGVIGAFLRDSKKPKTQADKLRAMSDLELGNFIKSVHMDGTCKEYALNNGNAFTDMFGNKPVGDWLQSEVEE